MNSDVYICYARKDSAYTHALCSEIEKRGFRCWIAPRDVEPGESWFSATISAIVECHSFLLIFSLASMSSQQVSKELTLASERHKPIIPLRIDDAELDGAFFYHLSGLEWVDAVGMPREQYGEKLSLMLPRNIGHDSTEPIGKSNATLANVDAKPVGDSHVFISHTQKDRVLADDVCSRLENRGIPCWIAPRNIPRGSTWTDCIVDAVDSCSVMIVVFSAAAVQSTEMKREITMAANRKKILMPLRVDDVPTSSAFAYYFENVQWEVVSTPVSEEQLNQLEYSLRPHVRVTDAPVRQTASSARPLHATDAESNSSAEQSLGPPAAQTHRKTSSEPSSASRNVTITVAIVFILVIIMYLTKHL